MTKQVNFTKKIKVLGSETLIDSLQYKAHYQTVEFNQLQYARNPLRTEVGSGCTDFYQ